MNAQDYSSWRFTSQPPTVKERSSATSIPFSFLPTLHSRELTLVRNLFLDSLFPLDQQNDWDTLQNNLVKLLPAYTFVDEWNQQPHQISACPTDISGDGNKDCILANPYLFLWIDPVGGGILFIYGKINGTLHQIIAPGMTLTNGQTEPSQWDFRQGIYLEKRMDSVALQDNPPYPRYEIGNDSVIFGNIPSEVNLQHNYTKLVHIENKRLEVVYQNPVNQPLIIPLNLDPWNRFEKGWSNNYKICMANGTYSSDTLCWSYQSNNPNHDIFVRITAGTSTNNGMPIMQPIKLSIETFKDTQFRFLRTEDPNQEKPIGHYLPFPMSLIRILSSNSEPLRITITISNDD